MKGKETEGNLMKKKRQRSGGRDRVVERDRLSELPDCVLLHVMKFLDTKEAVQTCLLSKRWKDLWKSLTHLTFHSSYFFRLGDFNKFVCWVLSGRDGSISVHSLDFKRRGSLDPNLLNRIMKYAWLHNIHHLAIHAIHLSLRTNFQISPFIFSCPSLTSLRLSIHDSGSMIKLPKSLQLPAIRSMHLEHVTFTASDNDCAEPFSSCNVLSTLVLKDCYLHNGAKVLCISNSHLFKLTINNSYYSEAFKIVVSTPNLSSINILGWSINQLSSICNLSVLEEANIDPNISAYPEKTCLPMLGWLQLFTNVKIMTLSLRTLNRILYDLSKPGAVTTQPPSFFRLELLKVEMGLHARKSEEEVHRIVQYLLQNSPEARVDVYAFPTL